MNVEHGDKKVIFLVPKSISKKVFLVLLDASNSLPPPAHRSDVVDLAWRLAICRARIVIMGIRNVWAMLKARNHLAPIRRMDTCHCPGMLRQLAVGLVVYSFKGVLRWK